MPDRSKGENFPHSGLHCLCFASFSSNNGNFLTVNGFFWVGRGGGGGGWGALIVSELRETRSPAYVRNSAQTLEFQPVYLKSDSFGMDYRERVLKKRGQLQLTFLASLHDLRTYVVL